jgi:hypothetical protein
MEYCHKGSPAPKKFKTAPSAGKVMLAAVWDVNGVMNLEFMSTSTINSAHYIGMLQKLKVHI